MANNVAQADSWLNQVNYMEKRKRHAASKAQSTQHAQSSTRPRNRNQTDTPAHEPSNHLDDLPGKHVQESKSSHLQQPPGSTTPTFGLSIIPSSDKELTENPFTSPLDSLCHTSPTIPPGDEDEEDPEYSICTSQEGTESSHLLPSNSKRPPPIILKGKGVVQSLSARFDLATRAIRRRGKWTLRMNSEKHYTVWKEYEAFQRDIRGLKYWEKLEAEELWKENMLSEREREKVEREEIEYGRLVEGRVSGVLRPVG